MARHNVVRDRLRFWRSRCHLATGSEPGRMRELEGLPPNAFAKEDLAIQATINNQAQVAAATPYAVMQKTKAPIKGLFQMTHLVFFAVADNSIKDWKALDGQPFTLVPSEPGYV